MISFDEASDGVIVASHKSAVRLKLQVSCGNQTYNYDLPSDGTQIAVPCNMGNGTYRAFVMENIGGSEYAQVECKRGVVRLSSQMAPFLRPNAYCDYDKSGACVAKAVEITDGIRRKADKAPAICGWVAANVAYDYAKAALLMGGHGYVPNPDRTLSERTGICFDFASLTCAMLRSQGIPTKIVNGDVNPGMLFHSWIVTCVNGGWRRYDTTFWSVGVNDPGKRYKYTDRYIF